MSKSMDGWSALRGAAQSALLAALASLRPYLRPPHRGNDYSLSFLFFLLKSSSTNPPLHSGNVLRAAFA